MNINQRLERVFEDLLSRPESNIDSGKCLIIFSTPRVGSTLFCQILQNCGSIGYPEEWFNDLYLQAYCNAVGKPWVDFWKYLDFIKRRTSSEQGWFSVKVHINQWLWLKSKEISVENIPMSASCWLYRKDKIAQAYSFLKAEYTDQWRSEYDALRPFYPNRVTPAQVLYKAAELAEMEMIYEKKIKAYVDHDFAYEEFSDFRRSRAFGDLLRTLGLDSGRKITDVKVNLKRQRTPEDLYAIDRARSWLGMGT